MKAIPLKILPVIIFLACSCRESNNQNTYVEKPVSLPDKAVIKTVAQADTLGPIIFTIEFKIKASGEDLKTFEDGFIPWVNIDNPKLQLEKMVDVDKTILPYSSASIIIDYPLNYPAVFEIKSRGEGFSRRQLIMEISSKYHEIYKLEESTAKTKTIPVEKREGLYNRNQTDGKFGVWGHDITDLDLSTIEVHKNSKGQITLTLGIES
jgi:hypothetical protein